MNPTLPTAPLAAAGRAPTVAGGTSPDVAGASRDGAGGFPILASGTSSDYVAAARPLLAIEGLEVTFPQGREGRQRVAAVCGASLTIGRGECVGLVGESGSGKSLLALAVLRLVPPPGRVGGRVLLDGREPGGQADLLALPEAAMRQVRGARIGIVFQEPMTALNPFYSIGFQIAEAAAAHRPLGRRAAREEAVRLLERVAIPDARRRLADYPHQLSGGQRQRVMLAMALAGGPELLLADEPTTALDVTLQAQVLELLDELRHDLGLSVLLITHDLAVVAETCDRVAVMYAGQVVEEAAVEDLFRAPAHPYTRALLATLPRLGRPAERGRLPVLPGQPAEPAARPAGCPFHPRCPEALPLCAVEEPPETEPLPAAEAEASAAAVATGASAAAVATGAATAVRPRRVRCWLHPAVPR
jgi:peptide/nickel transport system ATP-binding protein